MSALEACRWEDQFAEHWTEKRPAPLVMTDKEVLDWLGKHAHKAEWMRGTDEYVGHWNLYADDLADKVRGDTLREVVCLAAAMLEERS